MQPTGLGREDGGGLHGCVFVFQTDSLGGVCGQPMEQPLTGKATACLHLAESWG